MSAADDQKRAAAERAVESELKSGIAIGLGTGSTAAHVVRAVGRLLAAGELRDVVAVPTSEATAALAREVGVPLVTLAERPELAVCIDGADEIAPDLSLVKGLGGALLREKVVASAAERFVVVADRSKLVERLGARAPLPVEVIPFAEAVCARALARLGCEPALRRRPDGEPFVTDEANRILDCRFGPIADAAALDVAIDRIPGVVEHGLFLGMAAAAYVASSHGVEVIAAR
jgi:ribose 5-phosphate isomerase A